jgi:hypothetical protein
MPWYSGAHPLSLHSPAELGVTLTTHRQDDLENSYAQLTVEFTSKQTFAAYDVKGKLVAGDPNKTVRLPLSCLSILHPADDRAHFLILLSSLLTTVR